jgi:hypothetical protein
MEKQENQDQSDEAVSFTKVVKRPTSTKDKSDPSSLYNILNNHLQKHMDLVTEDLLMISEADLKSRVKPTPTDYALRVSFWREFERIMARGTGKVIPSGIYGGICSEAYFNQKFIRNIEKFAWMVRPMQTYEREIEAILYRGTQRLWELIDINIYKDPERTKVDPKLAEVLLKTIQQVENRAKGMAVQRSEQKSMNVNVNTDKPAIRVSNEAASIDKRLAELQNELKGVDPQLLESSDDDREIIEA